MTKLIMLFTLMFSYTAFGKKLDKKRKPAQEPTAWKVFDGNLASTPYQVIRVIDEEMGAVCYATLGKGSAIHCISTAALPAR